MLSMKWDRGSESCVALDACAFHLSMAGRVIHNGVVLSDAVVPERYGVRLPAPPHLVFGDLGLADEVLQQLGCARRVILSKPDVCRGVVVCEMRRETIDEE